MGHGSGILFSCHERTARGNGGNRDDPAGLRHDPGTRPGARSLVDVYPAVLDAPSQTAASSGRSAGVGQTSAGLAWNADVEGITSFDKMLNGIGLALVLYNFFLLIN